MDMNEVLANVRAWAVLDASTQITKERTYVERIWYRVGNNGDQLAIYDGVGTTGKKFLIMEATKDRTKVFDLELVFHDGLYFEDVSGGANVVISYIRLPD